MGDHSSDRIEWRVEDWVKLALHPHMLQGLARYIEDGVRPGDFLVHVLKNDFCGAVLRADELNRGHLRDFGLVMMNAVPPCAHGSHDRVEAWIEGGGLNGLKAASDKLADEPLRKHEPEPLLDRPTSGSRCVLDGGMA